MMLESRDPAIKLFGKTIPVAVSLGEEGVGEIDINKVEIKDPQNMESNTESDDKQHESPSSEENPDQPLYSTASDTQKSSDDQENSPPKNIKSEEQQNDTCNSQEKTMKKPDKILPCPRCNSLDTKFCYYNNYNVNQPRHFCKNCQRYWTAGGTMRNVPVGAGRRKNKNSASHYRHITLSDSGLQTARPDFPESLNYPSMKPEGTVLSFGSDATLCESMASVLNIADKAKKNCNRNGFHSMDVVENGEEQSSGSSVTVSNSTDEGSGANLPEPFIQNWKGFPPQVPSYNGSPWPYPWSPAPGFFASSYPVSFYPANPYWGCSVPAALPLPWLLPVAAPLAATGTSTGANSPTLGKHSREGDAIKNSNSEKGDDDFNQTDRRERCIWIPKTLRIDDPEEAAKSSIWATMGFKNDKADDKVTGGGLFKAFKRKADMNSSSTVENSHLLHANPAAFSRSLKFHEIS